MTSGVDGVLTFIWQDYGGMCDKKILGTIVLKYNIKIKSLKSQVICHKGWPFDFILGGLRLCSKQKCIINNMLHIKRSVIWIKPTLCQLEQIGRKKRRGSELLFCFTANCAFAVFHDLCACLFRGSPDSKINWPEWWSFGWVLTASRGW